VGASGGVSGAESVTEDEVTGKIVQETERGACTSDLGADTAFAFILTCAGFAFVKTEGLETDALIAAVETKNGWTLVELSKKYRQKR
jgi:hypothetical protein